MKKRSAGAISTPKARQAHNKEKSAALPPMSGKDYDPHMPATGEVVIVDRSWYNYARARDEMFAATDSSGAPWFVARSEDKKRGRLNAISHLLMQVPYKKVPTPKVTLPKRKIGRYKAADYPFKFIADGG